MIKPFSSIADSAARSDAFVVVVSGRSGEFELVAAAAANELRCLTAEDGVEVAELQRVTM